MKKPEWDVGSNLWKVPTYKVEEYVEILEQKIIDLSHELDACQCRFDIIEQEEQLIDSSKKKFGVA